MTAQIMREVFRCGQTLLAMSSNGKSKKHATRFCIRYKGLARESPRNSNSPEWRRPELLGVREEFCQTLPPYAVKILELPALLYPFVVFSGDINKLTNSTAKAATTNASRP
jgi:hypothetical protein